MNIFKILLVTTITSLLTLSSYGQSLSKLSNEDLEVKKNEAIAAENFELAGQIKEEQASRKSIDDKLKSKDEELKAALASENYEKAEALKKEIKQLETDKAKLVVLKEDRKIAIFQEKYDKVITIEKEMQMLRTGKSIETPAAVIPVSTLTTTSTNNTTTTKGNYFKPVASGVTSEKSSKANYKLKKVNLLDYTNKDKAISQYGFGMGSYTYTESYTEYDYWSNTSYTSYYDYSETVFALTFSTSRWWINNYLAAGWFFESAPTDFGGFSLGPQITGFADFESILLPYATLASGYGYKSWDENFYVPFVFKIGSYLFFKDTRGFGVFTELNITLNYSNLPKYRVGIAWSNVKRSARK